MILRYANTNEEKWMFPQAIKNILSTDDIATSVNFAQT